MRKKGKIRRWILAAAALTVCLAVCGVLYLTRWKKTPVLTETAPDGSYTLTLGMVGDADFPFGATHCYGELYRGNRRQATCLFDVGNDGKTVDGTNFTVTWTETAVLWEARGEEAEPVTYRLALE